jgi:hypothetical protein
MAWLSPAEFSVGSFPEAEGLTLILPRNKHDEPILITQAGPEKVAIYLGKHKYDACPCGDSDGWKGLLVAGVSIEVDEASVFDPDYEDPPLGAVVREGASLDIIAKIVDSHHIRRAHPVAVVTGLPPCRERASAGFRKWRIVKGEGRDKRELFPVSLPLPKEPAS